MTPLRDRILDATFKITAERGWPEVTMAEVGRTAGVSRQSVYNEFGNKQALAEAMVTREVMLFLEAVDAELSTGDSPAEAGVRATNRVFALAADNPLLHSVLSAAGGGTTDLLPLLTSQSGPMIDNAVQRITTTMRENLTGLPGEPDLTICVDAIVRVVLSRLIQPGTDDAESVAFVVRALLAGTSG